MTLAVVAVLLAAALAFHAVAAIGVVRLPDFYTRLHAVAKVETVGVLLTIAAIALWTGATVTTVKVAFVAAFLFLSSPTATHALGGVAHRLGVRPWTRRPEDGE